MKICYIADGQSIHTQRWCRAIALRGHDVTLLTFRPVEIEGVKVHNLWRPFSRGISREASFLSRIFYLFGILQARRIVKELEPDILHGFYATSYGLITALTGHKPYLISVWGSDINISPQKWIYRKLVKYILHKAESIFCTSNALLESTRELVSIDARLIHIPFGVELEQFTPDLKVTESIPDTIVIGTTKSLEKIYGIEFLIEAFAQCYQQNNNLRLHLVGNGTFEPELRRLAVEKGIEEVTCFIPNISHEKIPEQLRKMHIFGIPSKQESFGVAALEASAMKLPVVGSRVGGIPEVVQDGETGLLVPAGDVNALRDALLKLITNPQLRVEMGDNGRAFVKSHYSWSKNVDSLLKEYELRFDD